jgi:hypothetical protein
VKYLVLDTRCDFCGGGEHIVAIVADDEAVPSAIRTAAAALPVECRALHTFRAILTFD